MKHCKIVILGNPATKKNSGKIVHAGRPMLIPSESYRKYSKVFRGQLAFQKMVHFDGDRPLHIKALYYLRDKAHYPDLVGLMQATADLLQDEFYAINHKRQCVAKWVLSDDSIIKSWDGTKIAGLDKENPRVEIEIEEMFCPIDEETNPKIIKEWEARHEA